MAFKIEPFGGQRWKGHYADHHDVRAHLFREELQKGEGLGGVPHKLPMDFRREVRVPLVGGGFTDLRCVEGKPSTTGDWRGKSSAHRTFARCPDCARWVPAGRTHQHKCRLVGGDK